VSRKSLLDRLERARQVGIHTLFPTPAGFGKTTLVGDWIRGAGKFHRGFMQQAQSRSVSLSLRVCLNYLVELAQRANEDGFFNPP
jgi:hypothetical protein